MTLDISKRRKVDAGMNNDRPFNAEKRKPLRTRSRFDSDSEDHTDDETTQSKKYEGTHFPQGKKPHQKQSQRKEKDAPPVEAPLPSSDDESGLPESEETGGSSDSESGGTFSDTSSALNSKKRKRNDPDAFANSISKILSSKLTTSKRSDPLLSRSKEATEASKELAEARLDVKARHKLRQEKRDAMDRGRVRDVLGVEDVVGGKEKVQTGETVQETEKRLRKTAQRGVIKLFNAVRASQVRAEEAAQQAKQTGLVGMGRREERATEMSKKGFLDLLAGGGSAEGSEMLRKRSHRGP